MIHKILFYTIGSPEAKDTSLIVLQNPSRVTNLENYFYNYFYPISGTPDEALTAAPEI